MIDAHTHLHDHKFDEDRDEMIARASRSGLEAMVTIGTSLEESRDAITVASKYENVYATVGLHPHIFNGGQEPEDGVGHEWMKGLGVETPKKKRMKNFKSVIAELEEIAKDENVRAIGEIGLDYFSHDKDQVISVVQRGWQRTGFVVQIALAKKLGLPVVVHCRPDDIIESDAYHRCVDILAEYSDVEFVMHCYMGNIEVTEKFLALPNVVFSFTGNVTYSKTDDDVMSQVVRMIPLERMMIETDAPYLTPVPHRGKRNESAFVVHVAKRIADLKDMPLDEVKTKTTQTTKAFFKI